MRVLVAIANFGTANDRYLRRLLAEYRGMAHDVDIVVTSNIHKDLGPAVEVIVGLPSKDPWSLGFAHKKIFADRAGDYDLFIYSEDDMLITQRNIDAFMRAADVLSPNELPGFFRSEAGPDSKRYFPDVRQHYRWDAASVCRRGEYLFAFFTNEHAACYALTQDQLLRAIKSGGFLVGPHEGRYDLLVAAATDPYTQCTFTKMVSISHLEDFLVPHLPNKYAPTGDILCEDDFCAQLRALRSPRSNSGSKAPLFPVETRLYLEHFSKSYYERCQDQLISLVPNSARSVLSVGCGWGDTERRLRDKGIRVTAVPMDSVIAASAESRGVEIIYGDAKTAREKLAGERFECLMFSNVLHLVPNPIAWLTSFAELVVPGGHVVASVPNLSVPRRLWRWIRLPDMANPRSYDQSGMHVTTGRVVRSWFRQAGLGLQRINYSDVTRHELANRWSFGAAKPLIGSDVYVSGVWPGKVS